MCSSCSATQASSLSIRSSACCVALFSSCIWQICSSKCLCSSRGRLHACCCSAVANSTERGCCWPRWGAESVIAQDALWWCLPLHPTVIQGALPSCSLLTGEKSPCTMFPPASLPGVDVNSVIPCTCCMRAASGMLSTEGLCGDTAQQYHAYCRDPGTERKLAALEMTLESSPPMEISMFRTTGLGNSPGTTPQLPIPHCG